MGKFIADMITRVNMYASAWICTKTEMTSTKAVVGGEEALASSSTPPISRSSRASTLEELDIGLPMIEEGAEGETTATS